MCYEKGYLRSNTQRIRYENRYDNAVQKIITICSEKWTKLKIIF